MKNSLADFPHPNHRGPIPDDGALVDLIGAFAPNPEQRQVLLTDNPQWFYRFGALGPALETRS